MASQDVEPGVYAVSLTIDYEGGTGGPWNAKEEISFPVSQQQRLDIQGFIPPTDGALGSPIPIQFQYINKGKATIYNFSVSVEGNFTMDGGDTYIGNLTAGFNDYFDSSLIATAEGTQKGAIVLKYEDSQGNEKTEKKEFTVNVMPMDQMTGMIGGADGMIDPETGLPLDPATGKPMKQGGGILPIILWSAGGVIVIGGGLAGFFIIRKKRKAKKELVEDEED